MTDLLALLCVIFFLCFCRFPIWCPRSGLGGYLIVLIPDLCLLLYFNNMVLILYAESQFLNMSASYLVGLEV